jgi:flagellar basal body-associated protein FliL
VGNSKQVSRGRKVLYIILAIVFGLTLAAAGAVGAYFIKKPNQSAGTSLDIKSDSNAKSNEPVLDAGVTMQ